MDMLCVPQWDGQGNTEYVLYASVNIASRHPLETWYRERPREPGWLLTHKDVEAYFSGINVI